MKKTTNQIIAEIRTLLDELEGAPSGGSPQKTTPSAIKKVASGCIGAIQGLIGEGFFDTQKTVSNVVDKLKEEGQSYSKALVSMNLLNLVKPPRKTLRRIEESKQWHYILRK